jgi:hypothetical protein
MEDRFLSILADALLHKALILMGHVPLPHQVTRPNAGMDTFSVVLTDFGSVPTGEANRIILT